MALYNTLSDAEKKTLEIKLVDEIRRGNLDAVRELLDRGVPIEMKDPNFSQATPLAFAVSRKKTDIAKFLIDRGADVNARDIDGMTSLIWAVVNSDPEMVDILVAKGADVNAIHSGVSVLMNAISMNNEAMVDKLLNAGANPRVHDADALHYAIEFKRPAMVQKLLDKGADINARKQNGNTPLMEAIEMENTEIINLLIDRGADVNLPGQYERLPFVNALFRNMIPVVEKLIEKGANINAKMGVNGDTALMTALRYNNIYAFQKLLQMGADPTIRNNGGETILLVTRWETVFTPELIDTFLARGVDINAQTHSGWTALMQAIDYGNLALASLLIDKGADVNKKDSQGRTALMVTRDNPAAVTLLLDAGADINAQTSTGETTLLSAIQRSSIDVTNKLIERGADVNLASAEKLTPLMAAVRNRDGELIEVLIQKGADPTAKDQNGRTAMQYTNVQRIKDILKAAIASRDNTGPWKGPTQKDLAPYYDILEKGGSFCPMCLTFVAANGQYAQHECPADTRHAMLYAKYKKPDGMVSWCTVCGRPCQSSKHFKLALPSATTNPEFHPITNNTGGEAECRANGGGGLEEKIKRTEMLLKWNNEFKTDAGKLTERKATKAAVEQAWFAPFVRVPSRIAETKQFSVPKTEFPAEGGARRRTYRSKKRS
jgi:uncharacterized protein